MIKRIWHGWTTVENADLYEKLLLGEIIPGIAAKKMSGYHGIEVLRRAQEPEVEFITVMTFDSLESIKQFVGDDPSVAHVPASARAVLSRWDQFSQHYQIRETAKAAPEEANN